MQCVNCANWRQAPFQGRAGCNLPCQSERARTRQKLRSTLVRRGGVVAEFRAGSEFPLSRTGLSYALNLGSAEGIEAVHQCDADVDFGGLTIGIA